MVAKRDWKVQPSHPKEVIAVANGKPDLYASGMVAGVMYALSTLPAQRMGDVDFYDIRADRGMVAVFEFVRDGDEFDLRFHMSLDQLYGDCPTWRQEERARALGVFFRRWTGGPCELLMPPETATKALRSTSIPGDIELWTRCAEVFLEAYWAPPGPERSREPAA